MTFNVTDPQQTERQPAKGSLMDVEDRETCQRCGADLLDNPSPQAGDDLCFDCRYEEDEDAKERIDKDVTNGRR